MWQIILLIYLVIGFFIINLARSRKKIILNIDEYEMFGSVSRRSTSFLIIFLSLILWPLFFQSLLSSNNDKEDYYTNILSLLNNIRNNSKDERIDEDELPNGYGNFGLIITNPIPCTDELGCKSYLDRLRTIEGEEIIYEYFESKSTNVSSYNVDIYKILNKKSKIIAALYILPYQDIISNKSPLGFILDKTIVNDDDIKLIKNKRQKTSHNEYNALEWYSKMAEQGDADAHCYLGHMYRTGKGAPKDLKIAARWYEKAIELGLEDAHLDLQELQDIERVRKTTLESYLDAAGNGDRGAQCSLGLTYYKGYHGVSVDQEKALQWFTRAAEQGDAGAQHALGEMYSSGEGVTQDKQKAVVWYTKAAEQGNRDSLSILGYMYYIGDGVLQDFRLAADLTYKAAKQGDAEAQDRLGGMHFNGDGVNKDHKLAAEWFTKSANQGYIRAQYDLGMMYEMGAGVNHDMNIAAEWYIRSALHGHTESQYTLGKMYYTGNGIDQDKKLAAEWFSKAAEQGHKKSQLRIGEMYCYGDGVKQELEAATTWFTKAAEQGVPDAQYILGRIYFYGINVFFSSIEEDPDRMLKILFDEKLEKIQMKRDIQIAAEWYTKAAEQGHAKAQSCLGQMYQNGEGVIQDIQKATELFTKAADQGDEDAQFCLGQMHND